MKITGRILIFLCVFCFIGNLSAQTGTIRGTVVNKLNNEAVPFAPIAITGTTLGTTSSENGTFELKGLQPGVYNLEVAVIGFKRFTLFDVEVKPTRVTQIKIELEEELRNLDEVVVKPSAFVKIEETPVSIHNIGEVEIKRNPGANRDISKALQSLPGSSGYRQFPKRFDYPWRFFE
ncbi:MAG: carboxypeptidase-like regulatory domain-containing protein [Bacteroidetes bacterium]|nr:carboxypeptidase-like regulatory domain-containing protein [Bacteroidota bacterium]